MERGKAPDAVAAFRSAEEFSLGHDLGAPFSRELQQLYAAEPDDLRIAAENTFEAIRRIESIPRDGATEHGAKYDENDDFAQGLRQVARLIKANVGLDAASVDIDGWDTHFTQETLIVPLMRRLATDSPLSAKISGSEWSAPRWSCSRNSAGEWQRTPLSAPITGAAARCL